MATPQNTQPQPQHVVAVPLPAQGHLTPLMRFCQLLSKHPGFIVTFVDFESMQAPRPHGEQTPAAAPSHTARVRRACIPIDGLHFSGSFSVSFRDFQRALPSMAPHLQQLILSLNRQGPPVTCLLSDFLTTVPTQDVADKLGIPRIVFYVYGATRMLLTHYISQGDDSSSISMRGVMEALAQVPTKRGEVFLHGIPGLPTLYYEDIPHFRHVVDDTQFLWEAAVEAWQICNARAHGIVVNTFMDLEKPSLETLAQVARLPVYDVGIWLESLSTDNATSLWKEDTSCMSWLDGQPTASVLYISFGSITVLSRSQLEEFKDGLISSGQRFLWVFRPDIVRDIDHSSYVADIMAISNGKGLVINWAPQLEVLAHPSVGGFLTHCGWNSLAESIINGVPMLCWPYFADQPLNARCIIDEWKIGLGFKATWKKEGNGIIERDEVDKGIRGLMEGEEGKRIRQNAKDLKEKGSQCLLERGSSTKKLKVLVESLLH